MRAGRRRFLAAGGALALSACAGLSGERQGGYAEVNGTRLHYESAGSGEPVVLLHSFTLDLRMWDTQFDALARTHRVIRYDARGFGRSAVPQAGQAYAHHEDLDALLARFGAERPHLVGHGMGGRFALDYAVTYPSRCRSIALLDTVIGGWPWSKAFLEGYAPVIAASRRGDAAAARAAWLAHPVFGPVRAQPEAFARVERMVGDYSGWHFVNPDPARAVTPPVLGRMGALKVPALVMFGERDLPDFRQMSERAARELGVRASVIPGRGHLLPMEAPAEVSVALAGLVAGA